MATDGKNAIRVEWEDCGSVLTGCLRTAVLKIKTAVPEYAKN